MTEHGTDPMATGFSPVQSPAVDAELRTFLIADVRGYTSFTQRFGDEKAAKLAARFANVAREVVQQHQGSVLELRGDEALCVFVSPRQAVRAAVALQRRFVEETRFDADLPMPVGIGIDVGEAVPVEGGYRSGALNLAARLCSIAKAGEILATGEVTHLARQLDGLSYAPLDAVRLKGLTDPVRPVRVLPDGEDPRRQLAALGALPPQPVTPRGPRWLPAPLRGRPRLAALTAVVVSALLVATALVTTRGGGGESLRSLGEDVAGVLSVGSGELVGQTHVGAAPGAVLATHDAVWVANTGDDTVSRIDIATGDVTQTTDVGANPSALAAGAGSIWVANSASGTVSRIDPRSGRVRHAIPVGSGPSGLAFDSGVLWVVDATGGTLFRIDPKVDAAVLVAHVGAGPTSVAARGDQLWVSNSGSNTVVQVDPRSGRIGKPVPVGNDPRGVAIVGDSLWVTNNLDGTVTRLAMETATVLATLPVGAGPVAVAGSHDAVWVAATAGQAVSRIDPRTNRVLSPVHTGSAPTGLALAGDRLWLSAASNPALHRGGTMTVALPEPGEVDPTLGYYAAAWAVDVLLYDGLVTMRRSSGATGNTVVPDLALALPTVSDDGRTFTFRLRSGVTWSTGAPVTGLDIRRGFERTVAAHQWPLYDGIVGAKACSPKSCDLSRGIEADAHSSVVTIHLAAADPEFVYKIALPGAVAAPADTPLGALGHATLPSTGPYLVASHSLKHVELVRNPRFRSWSIAARPDGYVDRISFEVHDEAKKGWSPADVDWVMAFNVPDPGGLMATYGDRVIPVITPAVHSLFFNANRPPFNSALARRAVAYAIDRDALAGDWDIQGEVTCQVLPPSIPGYAPNCPFTLRPDASGAWHAPDLLKAQQLVRRSGTVNQEVGVYAPKSLTGMKHIVDAMNSIGYRAVLHPLPDDRYFPDLVRFADRIQAGFEGWGADYPAASNFFQQQLACAQTATGNYGHYCDRRLDRQMAAAAKLQVSSPDKALALWTRIDREVVDDSPLVPLIVPTRLDIVSGRLGHHQVNLILGPMFDQAWVH